MVWGPAEGPVLGTLMRNGELWAQAVLLLPTVTSLCPSLPLRDNVHQTHLDPGAIGETKAGGTSSAFLPQGGQPLLLRLLHFSVLSFFPSKSLPFTYTRFFNVTFSARPPLPLSQMASCCHPQEFLSPFSQHSLLYNIHFTSRILFVSLFPLKLMSPESRNYHRPCFSGEKKVWDGVHTVWISDLVEPRGLHQMQGEKWGVGFLGGECNEGTIYRPLSTVCVVNWNKQGCGVPS